MSKKNNRATRARQVEFDRKRETEQLKKQATKKTKAGSKLDLMQVDSGKIKKRQFKVGKKRKFKLKSKQAAAAAAMQIDS